MKRLQIGLLHKKRGNFRLQEKFAGPEGVKDETTEEVAHHQQALEAAGYGVSVIRWSSKIMQDLSEADIDLVFNVSSMVEAAVLEELEIPFVGSDTFAIALATDKHLAKKLWLQAGLPTSPFRLACTEDDCQVFRTDPPFSFPLFVKPVAGRGSAGITESSVVETYEQLVDGVRQRYETIGQPVLIERFLSGREITQGVLGSGDATRVLPPLQIVYNDDAVTLTFDKKEVDNDTFICPAQLTEADAGKMRRLAADAYRVLGLLDYGRIDAILTEEGPMLLEANTFAGLMCTPREKPHSYIGFMAAADDMGGQELLDEIVRSALARYHLVDRRRRAAPLG